MGTHVMSGSGKGTRHQHRQGNRVRQAVGEAETQAAGNGLRAWHTAIWLFLMEVTLVMVVAIFAINVYLARPVLDSFLFSLALAIGLTPQLLPAIISINLAHGAKRMAQQMFAYHKQEA